MQIRTGELRRKKFRRSDSGEFGWDVCHAGATALSASLPDDGRLLNAKQGRSQREMIRDVMLAASECGTWLTLGELRALTSYGEASISAQLRHLRKPEFGGYELLKRHREDATRGVRGESLWEYRLKQRGEAAQ